MLYRPACTLYGALVSFDLYCVSVTRIKQDSRLAPPLSAKKSKRHPTPVTTFPRAERKRSALPYQFKFELICSILGRNGAFSVVHKVG